MKLILINILHIITANNPVILLSLNGLTYITMDFTLLHNKFLIVATIIFMLLLTRKSIYSLLLTPVWFYTYIYLRGYITSSLILTMDNICFVTFIFLLLFFG